MITNKQKFSLIYFVLNSFFLSSGYSLIFKVAGKDAWLSMIIGSMIGVLIILIFNTLSFNKKRKYILNSKINVINKSIMIIFFTFVLFMNLLIARVFATSFFLTKTPGIIITIPFALLAFKNAKKGINSISKIAEILVHVSIVLTILAILAVYKDGSFASFYPLLTTGKSKIILASIYYAIFTTIPQLLLFDIKIDLKKHVQFYIIASIINFLIGIFTIFTLGPYLIKVFRFPEYMVLKQLKLFNFIEKIENLIGLIWFFDLFISSSISIYSIDKLTKSNTINVLILSAVILLIEFVTANYEYVTMIYKNLHIMLSVIGILFFLVIFKLARKNKKSS